MYSQSQQYAAPPQQAPLQPQYQSQQYPPQQAPVYPTIQDQQYPATAYPAYGLLLAFIPLELPRLTKSLRIPSTNLSVRL